MDKKELKTNVEDAIASGISAIVGTIPYLGGTFSEIIHNVIPNQRQDRIVKFIIELSDKLKDMQCSIEKLENTFSNYKYGAFTYKCINCVVNEVYEEKINYYKNLCANALTDSEKELYKTERILKIFSEMDYFEVLYLKYFYYIKYGKTNELHKIIETLEITTILPNYTLYMLQSNQDNETYKQITLNNLEKNGLLEIKVNTKYKIKYEITLLGELILKKIGVMENE